MVNVVPEISPEFVDISEGSWPVTRESRANGFAKQKVQVVNQSLALIKALYCLSDAHQSLSGLVRSLEEILASVRSVLLVQLVD
jgi:hypothetical protein